MTRVITPHEIRETALMFLNNLTLNVEEPQRSQEFHDIVYAARNSPVWADTVRTIYRLAADGEWQLIEPHDVVMLIYGLLENLDLVEDVRVDMEKVLRRTGAPPGTGVWSSWNYMLQLSAASLAAKQSA